MHPTSRYQAERLTIYNPRLLAAGVPLQPNNGLTTPNNFANLVASGGQTHECSFLVILFIVVITSPCGAITIFRGPLPPTGSSGSRRYVLLRRASQ